MTENTLPDPQRTSLEDFFSNEEFVAFFEMRQPTTTGNGLSGLCKVARPKEARPKVNYLSLTFIFDTPTPNLHMLAENSLAKLTAAAFTKYLPEVQSVTSVPCTERRAETYIHQMDILLSSNQPPDTLTALRHIVFTIRQTGGFQTEAPQLWDEDSAPKPTSAEKANWANRFKALMRVFKN